jgi:RHS repeat-associated protein
VIEQKYVDSSLSGSPTTDDFKYGYDADGNVLYRQNVNTANSTTTQDELYQYDPSGEPPADGSGYDALNQLTGFERGTLTASISGGTLDTISSPSASDSWSLDALGNWDAESVNGAFPSSRSFDSRNQISGDSYDSNGNVLDDGINTYTYDAWNRMATYTTDDGGDDGKTYYETYDALGRRIIEDYLPYSAGHAEIGGEDHPTYNALYYSSADQVVEEQGYLSTGLHTTTTNVWGMQDVNDLVEKDVHQVTGSTDHYYAQHDANFDVTALISSTGTVLERYEYDPYGRVTFLSPSWSTRSGSDYGMQYLFQGRRYSANSGLYRADARDYSSALGTWMEEDPVFPISGLNPYEYCNDSPVDMRDPRGLYQRPGWIPGHGFGTLTPTGFVPSPNAPPPLTSTPLNPSYNPGGSWIDQQLAKLVGQGSSKGLLGCLARCIEQHDPLNNLGKLGAQGLFGSNPKFIYGLGGKAVGQPGYFTSTGSAITTYLGGARNIGRGLRVAGAAGSFLSNGYNLYLAGVEAGCLIACKRCSSSY